MGFDVSYHPLDSKLVIDRLVPYIRGEGSIDDLVEQAVKLQRVRCRAKEWAGELLNIQNDDRPPATAFGWLRRRREKTHRSAYPGLAAFDPLLHVWGRPFFITAGTPETVCQSIDRYMQADIDTVDTIAREMADNLEVGLADKALSQLSSGQVTGEDEEMTDEEIAEALRGNLDTLRSAYAAHTSQKQEESLAGPDAPGEILSTSLVFAVFQFCGQLQLGWMDRGTVWPTELLRGSGVSIPDYVQDQTQLFGGILPQCPGIRDSMHDTIVENYSVGGYVPSEYVPAFRRYMGNARERILSWATVRGFHDECKVTLQKISEAAFDAERRSLGFIEATDIYSGIIGVLN